MNYTKEILLNRNKTKNAKNFMKNPGTDIYKTFSVTAEFPDEIEMDIKICPSDDGDFWTEAVLFYKGHEVACTEPEYDFFGEWSIEYNGNTYTTNIIGKK